jgi:ornithine decarboxylase
MPCWINWWKIIQQKVIKKGDGYPLHIFNDSQQRQRSILAGPTCDSIDNIAEDLALPELQEGDLVIGHMMGAYTHATSTRFNSLEGAKIVVINK